MSQTILIEDRENYRKLYSINLNASCSTDVIERDDAKQAIELLSILPNIDLIITRSRISDEYTAIDLINYLRNNDLHIPVIILGDCPEFNEEYLTLKEEVEWEYLVSHASKLLGITDESLEKKKTPDYIPVDISYFYEIDESPCDVFIRIKKGPSTYNYIKRLHANDKFNQKEIDKYKENGLRSFFVQKDNKPYFVRFVTNQLIQKIENTEMPVESRLHTNSSAYSIVKDKIEDFGLDEEVVELANASINSMITAIHETPKLSDLLKMLLSDKVSFAYQKAHLLCVIGDFILSKQSWYKQKHLDIFAFCSFFSDIRLKSRAQLLVRSQEELDASDLTAEEKEQVYTHAKDAAEICKDHPKFSSYINIILTQHHGTMTGEGFEMAHEDELHPISKIFIIADHFITSILSPNSSKDKKSIIDELHSKYEGDSFKKIIGILEKRIN